MATILYLSDLYYKAKGRKYYEEDLYITERIKDHFDVLIGHPQQAITFLDCADVVVFRNTGPVMWYKDYFKRFLKEVKEKGIITFNSFDGKADIQGKNYLLHLTQEGYPVIPTVDCMEDLSRLGSTDRFVVKLKEGADSIGMQVLSKEELLQSRLQGQLIQPLIPFEYEVSFYYLNNRFQYALYAPDNQKRWDLKPYEATADDLAFAERFILWNNMARGIVRVDACRLKDGSLLLVELEDLNPFLSIDVLSEEKREAFVGNFIAALREAIWLDG
ncbi:MAG TPA: hypothetical protein VGN63_13365 [Flavisolibacter sp.]|nr:hypothetical protein [Flavisolibacter sp.]